jgi:hypothetical protein
MHLSPATVASGSLMFSRTPLTWNTRLTGFRFVFLFFAREYGWVKETDLGDKKKGSLEEIVGAIGFGQLAK